MRNIEVVDFTCSKRSSNDVNTNIPFETNYAEAKSIQQANVVIAAYLNKNLKDINGVLSKVYLYNDEDVIYSDVVKNFNDNKIIFVKDNSDYYILSSITESGVVFTKIAITGDLSTLNTITLSSANVWDKTIINVDTATTEKNGLMSYESVNDINNLKEDVDSNTDDIETINDSLDVIEESLEGIEDKLDGTKPIENAVIENITTGNITSKNKFNKGIITLNSRINTATGATYSYNDYSVSDYIEVDSGEYYALTIDSNGYDDVYYSWYDSSKTYISGGLWTNKTSKPAPTGSKYLRFDFVSANIDEVQLEKGLIATSYVPYKKYGYNSQESMGDIVVDNIECKNLFNKNASLEIGALNVSTGVVDSSISVMRTTGYIEIQPMQSYFVTSADWFMICFYDSNKTFISGTHYQTTAGATFTTPANAKYIRFSPAAASLDTAQIEKGTQATSYVPFKNFDATYHEEVIFSSSISTGTPYDLSSGKKFSDYDLLAFTFLDTRQTFVVSRREFEAGVKVELRCCETYAYKTDLLICVSYNSDNSIQCVKSAYASYSDAQWYDNPYSLRIKGIKIGTLNSPDVLSLANMSLRSLEAETTEEEER